MANNITFFENGKSIQKDIKRIMELTKIRNFTVVFKEYGKEYIGSVTTSYLQLMDYLDYYLGAFEFEYCTPPELVSIVNDQGICLKKYTDKFNRRSKQIDEFIKNAENVECLNGQVMDWARGFMKVEPVEF